MSMRMVYPRQVYFGSTEFHPEPQWLMEAFDEEKQAIRCFAMRDIIKIY
jgi:predicted DNA-binding transcriptional regulator YafY